MERFWTSVSGIFIRINELNGQVFTGLDYLLRVSISICCGFRAKGYKGYRVRDFFTGRDRIRDYQSLLFFVAIMIQSKASGGGRKIEPSILFLSFV